MKKIISLLLALVCAFSLFSCGSDQNADIVAFADIVSASAPTKIVTNTSYNDGENTLVGYYETQLFGSDFVMNYNYQTYPQPAAGLDPNGFIVDVPGSVYYRDGLYSTDGGATWGSAVPDTTAMNIKINLDSNLIKTYNISQDKKTLNATVSAEEAEQILGVTLSAAEDADVRIKIVHDGKNIRQISVSYTSEYEAVVTIETSYTYSEVQSPFGDESDSAQ